MPSIAPAGPGEFDVTVYVVLQDFGRLGRAYRETDEACADKDTLIANIISGEFDNITRIVAFNTDEGWSRDVTEDIAREVMEETWHRAAPLTNNLRNFIDRFDLVSGA